jgi:NAD+ kinase
VVVLGGDGTMPRLRVSWRRTTHLIGINRIGSATDIMVDDMFDAVAEILSGQYGGRTHLVGAECRGGERV